ncbi:hypothetical protein PHLCEN_2v10020 [Hermanssonia centrifuga]|uniref:Uncharacterized protein n=1 Tax=Hermanssonia centrifuga TaxID=98765 RepID=A0A2R6NQ02_9APHY|nr:hypothetical protein PHLCEN_2v10020 [Hermanssonia centrifuga]
MYLNWDKPALPRVFNTNVSNVPPSENKQDVVMQLRLEDVDLTSVDILERLIALISGRASTVETS